MQKTSFQPISTAWNNLIWPYPLLAFAVVFMASYWLDPMAIGQVPMPLLIAALTALATFLWAQGRAQRRIESDTLKQQAIMLDLGSDPIALIDPESGRLLYANQALCQFFGLSPGALQHLNITTLSPSHPDIVHWQETVSTLRKQGPISHKERGIRPDGAPYYIKIDSHFIEMDDRAYIALHYRDPSRQMGSNAPQQTITSVLDNIDSVVYIADMESYEILYINPTAHAILGDVVGQTCWKTLQKNQLKPCDFCTNDKLLDAAGEPTGIYTWEFQNGITGKWYRCSDSAIEWHDGRKVRLEIATDITDEIKNAQALLDAQQQLETLAYYDPLTKLPNRRLFSDRLRQALARSSRSKDLLAICYLDLDGFKQINDSQGHEAGDQLLIQVVNRLQHGLRKIDTVARWGGDEFAMLLSGEKNIESCANTLNRLLESVSQPYQLGGHHHEITASIGVTLYPQDQSDPDTLMRHADQAMYAAKLRGRDRFYFFDSEQDRRLYARREHLNRIAEAIQEGELRLYYQPKVDMEKGIVYGMEALVRWDHPEQGILPPAEFLPLIEEHDLQYSLDWWVLNEAVEQLCQWGAQGLYLSVSINLSPKTIQQKGFTRRLKALLDDADIEYPLIELEILESSAVTDLDRISGIIKTSATFGVTFALDDYGTGYSSLAYIRRLPVQTLKIDQSFVRDMLSDVNDLNIVEGVIGLAKAFKREVIAEGVETIDIGVKLLAMGCIKAQGYVIAKPMPAETIPTWLEGYHLPTEWNAPAKLSD
jgi:diguanylate cyclase (GGDEF)-like protein/PAS domain S-box-containing protein